MNTDIQEIKTRKDFCDFLQEIIWDLQHDSSGWYYVHLLEYLEQLLVHMSDHLWEHKDDTNISFIELGKILDRARRQDMEG
jgi:hypothetical protein